MKSLSFVCIICVVYLNSLEGFFPLSFAECICFLITAFIVLVISLQTFRLLLLFKVIISSLIISSILSILNASSIFLYEFEVSFVDVALDGRTDCLSSDGFLGELLPLLVVRFRIVFELCKPFGDFVARLGHQICYRLHIWYVSICEICGRSTFTTSAPRSANSVDVRN